jgi:4-amino-4-deoxy-L-arabinose transferase-like glycosyltransferase
MNYKNVTFWLFTISVLILLVVPNLLKDGMFMDGLLYACVAKNLSQGLGTFWFPHYSPFMHNHFDQQPPLGLGIQALFFKLLGTSIYTERLYSLITLCLSVFLISKLWKEIFNDNNLEKNISWYPVLIWISIPVCFWAYSNNMLECTMVIFDMTSILFILKFFEKRQRKYLIISSVFVFLASMIKGPQGLFPLSTILFYWIVYRKISLKEMLKYSFILFLIVLFIYLFILLDNGAREGLLAFYKNRVLRSISSVSTVESRLYIIFRLVQELIIPTIISLLIFLIFRKKISIKNQNLNHIMFFLLIGISASFPLMITLEQRGFYLVTSLPFYAISIALISSPYLAMAIDKINVHNFRFKIFRWGIITTFIFSIIFSLMQIGKFSRDEEMLNDVYLIGKFLPEGTYVGTTYDLFEQWSLQEYFIRHFYICMSSEISDKFEYIIVDLPEKIPSSIKVEKIKIPTKKYHLYKVIKH